MFFFNEKAFSVLIWFKCPKNIKNNLRITEAIANKVSNILKIIKLVFR